MHESGRDGSAGRCLSQGRPRAASRRWRWRWPSRPAASIINADSMQVYRDLRIITARPSADEEARVPHRLYGHVDAAENYSVGRWCEDAARRSRDVRARRAAADPGRRHRALFQGADAGAVGGAADRRRKSARRCGRGSTREGVEALHAELARRDPATARAARSRATACGSRARWRCSRRPGARSRLARATACRRCFDPANVAAGFSRADRAELYRRIDARFDAMLTAGALDEVRALAARGLDPLLPAMKAHGVPWLIRHLQARSRSPRRPPRRKSDTRRYTKRQVTWFRHQMPEFAWVTPEEAARTGFAKASKAESGDFPLAESLKPGYLVLRSAGLDLWHSVAINPRNLWEVRPPNA